MYETQFIELIGLLYSKTESHIFKSLLLYLQTFFFVSNFHFGNDESFAFKINFFPSYVDNNFPLSLNCNKIHSFVPPGSHNSNQCGHGMP